MCSGGIIIPETRASGAKEVAEKLWIQGEISGKRLSGVKPTAILSAICGS
jgi:hypothetical protein